MKKLFIFIFLISFVSSPIDLKREINVYEDEEILNKYIDHLDGIDKEDYLPRMKKSHLITEKSNFNNSVINQNNKILNKNIYLKNIMKNIEFSNKNMYKIYKKELSKELEAKIDNSLSSYKNRNEVDKLFINNDKDKEEITKFKKMILNYAKRKINIFGKLENGIFITNKNENEIYNNIIEIDLE